MSKQEKIEDSVQEVASIDELAQFSDQIKASGEELGQLKAKFESANMKIAEQSKVIASLESELAQAKSYMIDNIKAAHAQISDSKELSESQKATFSEMEKTLSFGMLAMQLDFAKKTSADFTSIAPAVVASEKAKGSISEASSVPEANLRGSETFKKKMDLSKTVPGGENR